MTNALHDKYRPRTLDQIIGHAPLVQRFQNMIETGEWFSAILLTGEPSAGKTTLARALACSTLGVSTVERNSHPCFLEITGTAERSIDNVRNMITVSRQRPNMGGRRFLFIDEAHGLLSNGDAANALLVALESPPASTTWILGSMEPDKFRQSKVGRAYLSRCKRYHLEAPTPADMLTYAIRVVRGEGVSAAFTKEILVQCVNACGEQYRQLAHILQDLILQARSLPAGQKLCAEDVSVATAGGSDSELDANILAYIKAVYAGNAVEARKAVAKSPNEGYRFLSAMIMFHWNALVSVSGGSSQIFGIARDIIPLVKANLEFAPVFHNTLVKLKTDPTAVGFEAQHLFAVPTTLA